VRLLRWYTPSTHRAAPFAVLANLLLLFGPVMLVAGLVIGSSRLLAGGESTSAEVVAVVHGADGTQAPVVQFDVNDRRYVHESDNFVSAEFAVGEAVEIRYDPDDPNDARVVTFTGTWMMPLTLLVVGGLFTVVVVSMLRRRSVTTT
jgi:hypothetical protein